MSIEYNARRIVTDGLVLYLDAGIAESYVEGSTTWNDLSSYNNHGTVSGDPTYNSDNGGSIVFDGDGDFFNCGNSSSLQATSGEITLEAVVYIPDDVTGYGNISGKYFNNGFRWRRAPSNDRLDVIFDFTGNELSAPATVSTETNSFPVDAWHHIVTRFSQTGVSVIAYIDGVRQTADNSTLLEYPEPTGNYTIGYAGGGVEEEYWVGKIALYRHYDRALSDGGVENGERAGGEVAHNFNLLKDRFGL